MTHHTVQVTDFLKEALEKESSVNLRKAIIIALKRTTSESMIPSVNFPTLEKELHIHNQ